MQQPDHLKGLAVALDVFYIGLFAGIVEVSGLDVHQVRRYLILDDRVVFTATAQKNSAEFILRKASDDLVYPA